MLYKPEVSSTVIVTVIILMIIMMIMGEVAACPGEREKRLLLPFNVSNILDRDGFCWA